MRLSYVKDKIYLQLKRRKMKGGEHGDGEV